jgi:hypothetical protein
MHRVAVVVLSAATVIGATALIASSGSAQAPGQTAVHLIEKDQKAVGFFPSRQPRQGDRLGFGSSVTGDATGHSRGICTIIGRGQALCTIHEVLSVGTLTAQGIVNVQGKSKNAPFAITGGTGAYNGARGTALVTDVNSSTTDVRITLLP